MGYITIRTVTISQTVFGLGFNTFSKLNPPFTTTILNVRIAVKSIPAASSF